MEGSLLHRLDGPNEMVSLAKPPDQIATADLLEVAYRLTDRGDASCQSPLLSGLRLVQQNCVAESTLTELITERQATTV